jgi:hypothetical protein
LIICGLYAFFSAYTIIGFWGVELSSKTNGFDQFTRFGKQIIRLNPQKWKGLNFPLLPYIVECTKEIINHEVLRERLEIGNWTIVLYHHDCPNCQITMQRLKSDKLPNLVCIEVPPYNGIIKDGCLYGRLTDQETWFVATPSIIVLNNGKVVDVYSNF